MRPFDLITHPCINMYKKTSKAQSVVPLVRNEQYGGPIVPQICGIVSRVVVRIKERTLQSQNSIYPGFIHMCVLYAGWYYTQRSLRLSANLNVLSYRFISLSARLRLDGDVKRTDFTSQFLLSTLFVPMSSADSYFVL